MAITKGNAHGSAVAYESVESEVRFFVNRKRFPSSSALFDAIRNTFALEIMKEYQFTDIYYRGPNERVARVRRWDRNTGIKRRALPIQVIESESKTQDYKGIPFKVGAKKNVKEFDALRDAQQELEMNGFVYWMTISHSNGVHFRIIGGKTEKRVAIEQVTCTQGSSSWSSQMAELEVSSEDNDTVVKEITEFADRFGIRNGEMLGASMANIAEVTFKKKGLL
jgi:hypothetical protein